MRENKVKKFVGDEVEWIEYGSTRNGVIVKMVPRNKDYRRFVPEDFRLAARNHGVTSPYRRGLVKDPHDKLYLVDLNKLTVVGKEEHGMEACILFRLRDDKWQKKAIKKLAEEGWFNASADKILRFRQAQEVVERYIQLLIKAAVIRNSHPKGDEDGNDEA